MNKSPGVKRRGTIRVTLWALGVIVATLSLTSLIQHWSNVGLAGAAARVIDYYRTVAHAAKEVLFDWWTTLLWPDFEIPEWTIDALSIWALSGFGVLRGVFAFDAAQGEPSFKSEPGGSDDPVAWWTAALILLFAPIAFVLFTGAIILALCAIWTKRKSPPRAWSSRKSLLALAGGMYAPFVGATAFFVWNAIQL